MTVRSRIRCSQLVLAIGLALALAVAPAHILLGQPRSEAGVQGYPVAAGDLTQLAAELAKRFAGREDVRIVGDTRTRQIVAVAPPDVQRDIAIWLADNARPAAAPVQPPAMGQQPTTAASPQITGGASENFELQHIPPQQFAQEIVRIWGSRLTATTDEAGNVSDFRFPSAAGETYVRVDHRIGRVTIQAPPATAKSWRRVLQAIDVPKQPGSDESEIVTLNKADPAMVMRAVSLIRSVTGEPPVPPRESSHRRKHIGEFIRMVFQPAGEATHPAPPPTPAEAQPPPADAPATPPSAADEPEGPIGPVRIEILEGLDQIIVIGKKRDVDRVLKIIEEIEAQSLETRPEVEIVPLKHVDGEALNTLIQAVYADVFGARQGRVTITPLIKPNALLLIGRKENIPPVIELIQKLDRPTPPNAQLKVFPLKHMSAIDAERTVRNFFVVRPGFGTDPKTGLGTRVLVIAEFRTNSLIVQASPRDLTEVTMLLEKLDVETASSNQEVRVFRLRNALAEELAPVLQEAITGQGAQGQQQQQQAAPQQQGGGQGTSTPAQATRRATSLQLLRIGADGQQLLQSGILADMRITADTRGNSLIVIGPAKSMELMATLIQQLDELPAAEAQIKVFSLTNGDATNLIEMLQSLFGQQTGGGQGGQGQLGLQTATGAGESTLVPLRFSVDQRTNSVIASGNPGDLDVVRSILLRLDTADLTKRITTVYKLHNAPAADVATALNNLLTRQRDLNQAAPELVTPYQLVAQEVLIEPEIVTNSLIVSATQRYFDQIKAIVAELDKRPPMVVIQVLLAEVTLGENEQFGIEWGLQDSLLFDRGLTGGPRFNWLGATPGNDAGAASLATRDTLASQAISNFTLGRTDPTLGFGGLVLSASSESVNVLLRALQQSSRAQVISRPQVQTLDNQTAYVNVGALVPRITGVTQTTIGTANPSVTDISVGIILEVTPRTSPDGTIVMQINATKSQVGPEATGIPIFTDANGNVIRSPQIPITTAQTIVSARNGQTVVLGGLITNELQEETRRVPYLGDVPVLGRLFRFDSVRNTRTELLLIMTPFIIENPEQNEWLNARESERMSWCVADIVNIHGPVSMSGNLAFNTQESPLIFPDVDPHGVEMAPTPAQPPLNANPNYVPLPPPIPMPPMIPPPPLNPTPAPPPTPMPTTFVPPQAAVLPTAVLPQRSNSILVPPPQQQPPQQPPPQQPQPDHQAAQSFYQGEVLRLPPHTLTQQASAEFPRPLASPPGIPTMPQPASLQQPAPQQPQVRGLQPPTFQPAVPPPGTVAPAGMFVPAGMPAGYFPPQNR